MQVRSLSVSTLETALVQRLREEIIRGYIPGGFQLRVRELALRYEVSLTPVRNALARLEVEGYVTVTPRRGIEVTRLSSHDIEELVVMREALEGFAAEQAVRSMTPEAIALMRQHLIDERAALTAGSADLHRQFQLDRDFHMALYGVVERPTLLEKIEQLRQRSTAYMYTAASSLRRHERRSLEMHTALLEAVARADADAVKRITIDHVRNLATTVIPLLTPLPSPHQLMSTDEDSGYDADINNPEARVTFAAKIDQPDWTVVHPSDPATLPQQGIGLADHKLRLNPRAG